MEKLDSHYSYFVNVKSRKIHCVSRVKKPCYQAMDNESPKYFNDLEEAFLSTDAKIDSCKICMADDAKKWTEIKMKYRQKWGL